MLERESTLVRKREEGLTEGEEEKRENLLRIFYKTIKIILLFS